ncbi:MAG: GAF domain-containing sensor histidine kinase [Sediminibacterium sp.]|nr:GAF domain-containing sensor histidine kinase [Sediminibacterium sp.]MBX9780575.1 GAF domain-containing sensor histidine kinase [Chitinophagaceae bacterium]
MPKKKEPLKQINLFMVTPPIPSDDQKRLKELYRYEVLDTTYEDEFNDVVKLAATICGTPIALISLIDAKRQWFKAKIGIELNEFPREISFCAHTIASDNEAFEVPDTTKDDRFFDSPLVVGEPYIQFYAGVPLINSNGFKMGTISVMDTKPGELNREQIFTLQTLARQVVKLLDQNLLNKQLEQQRIKLQQQMELQNRILSIIAHDVRNPIGAVKSIIELNARKILSQQDSVELMNMAGKQIDGTVELLNNLVDWGSMQMRGQGFETEKVHMRTLVSNMFKSFEVMSSLKSNIMVNLVDEDLFVRSDINAMRFILRNLISNANKFTKEGVITVYAHKEEGKVMVSVSDTGVGMSADMQSKLFDGDHYQSTTGTGDEKGSGLGLILTKDFIEMLGGTIKVESQLDKGTSVYMHFND